MKKSLVKILGHLILLIMLISIVGVAQAKIEVRFTFWGGKEEKAAYEEMINKFNTLQDKIEIVPVHIPDRYEEKVLTMIGAGDIPDIMAIGGAHIPAFADRGALQGLDLYAPRINTEVYYSTAIDAMRWNRILYALPFRMNTKQMVYNLDMLTEAGITPPAPGEAWTPEEYRIYAKTLTIPGKRWGSGFPWWDQWLIQFGGRVLNEAGTECMLNRPEALGSLKYVYDLIWVDGAAPKPEEMAGQGNSALFMAEKIAMFTDIGPWYMPVLNGITKFKWGLGLQPGGSGEMEVVGLTIPSGVKDKQRDAAFEAIAFLTGDPRSQDILALTKTQIPCLKSSGILFAKQFPGAELFIQAIDMQIPQYKSPDSRAIGSLIGEVRNTVLTSFDPVPPEEALKKAYEGINKILEGTK